MANSKKVIQRVKENAADKTPHGAKRSAHWPAVRKAHLLKNPNCSVCGGTKKLEVHHKKPFHLHPEIELDPSNLITLCENKADGVNCHLFTGHLGSFKSFNASVDQDAALWAQKLKTRPVGDGS